MKKILLTALFVLIGTAEMVAQKPTTGYGAKEVWDKIGEATIDLQSGNESVITANAQGYKAIKIQADTPLFLDSFDVYFAHGQAQTVAFGGFDPVPLEGTGRRIITKVVIRCKAIDEGDKKARVAILGLRTNPAKEIKNSKVLVSR